MLPPHASVSALPSVPPSFSPLAPPASPPSPAPALPQQPSSPPSLLPHSPPEASSSPPPLHAIPASGVAVLDGGRAEATPLFCLFPGDESVTAVPTGMTVRPSRRTIAAQCCGRDGVCYRRYNPKATATNADCVAGLSQGTAPHITEMTYAEASEWCISRGLRLCAQSCKGEGCSYDVHPVYSQLPCPSAFLLLPAAVAQLSPMAFASPVPP